MSTATIELITPGELAALWNAQKDLAVIDVRTPGEFATVHATGAKLHPLHDLDPEGFAQTHGAKDKPVYILCKSGSRATQAAEQLLAAGFTRPFVVEGGTDAWMAAALPVERRGRNVIPLDRQMRTFAGFLIFLGALLAVLGHPVFVWVPLFMGLGLVFSGLTGACPMTGVIAKMPWNRGDCGSCQ
jgi:rhodanese-related sulfurtransferase